MSELTEIYGTLIADVPEPLRSALQERAVVWLAEFQERGMPDFTARDYRLLARLADWRATQMREMACLS